MNPECAEYIHDYIKCITLLYTVLYDIFLLERKHFKACFNECIYVVTNTWKNINEIFSTGKTFTFVSKVKGTLEIANKLNIVKNIIETAITPHC